MYSPFRSRGRRSSRELERGNSVRELTCNDSRDSRCPGTRTAFTIFSIDYILGSGIVSSTWIIQYIFGDSCKEKWL